MTKFTKVWGRLLALCILVLFSWILAPSAHATSVSYQALKYGTSQTSMADSYYVRPAQVTVSNNQYVVTMTIRTAANLGAWPVTVNSINGQAPQNVTKTQSGSNYDYTYSFTTKSLSGTISSAIYVSIPNVYTANHNISFKFDTSNLPALSGASTSSKSSQSTAATTTSGTSTGGTATSSATGTSTSASAGSDPQATKKLQTLASQAKRQSQAASKKESRLARQTLRQNAQAEAANQKNQRLYYYVLIGGSLGLIILIAAAAYFIRGAKAKVGKH